MGSDAEAKMKIITLNPELPPEEAPWWIGNKCRCGQCGTEFVLEEGDKIDGKMVSKTEGRIVFISLKCPSCESLIQHYRPYEIDPATFQRKYIS